MKTPARAAFTVLELVIATLIFLMIMGATLAVFFGSNREYENLSRDLEVNKDIVEGLEKLGRDIREASLVEAPPLLPLELTPPPFVHRSPEVSTGRVVLIHEKPTISASGRGLTAMRERVVWYLDRPKKLGKQASGAEVVSYALFRLVESTPPNKPEQVLGNVSELVTWRSFSDPNLGPAGAGTGPAVVHVTLKISQPRERADRKLAAGYAVQFTTCFSARGKDISTLKSSLGADRP